MSLRDFFTDDRINLMFEYQEKWRRVYLDTQPIDRIKAAAAVQQAYRVMGKPAPEIIFCPSFRAALDRLQIYTQLYAPPPPVPTMSADEARDYSNSFQGWVDGARLICKVSRQVQKASSSTLVKLQRDLEDSQRTSLEEYIGAILPKNLTSQQIVEYGRLEPRSNLSEQERAELPNLSAMFEQQIPWFPGKGLVSIFLLKQMLAFGIITNIKITDESGVSNNATEIYNSVSAHDIIEFSNYKSAAEHEFLSENPSIDPLELIKSCMWIDIAISVLNFPYDREQWLALKELAEQQCGRIIAMSKFCIVCDRPANNN